MTTPAVPESVEDAPDGTEPAVADKDTGKGLRGQLETALADNKTLRADARSRAFEDAGLDTSTGLGKAIAQVYEGEASKDAVAEFAKAEYGWVAPVTEAHPQAQQIATEQARIDQVSETAGSVAPPSQADALAKAEAEGDYATSMAIKGNQIADMFQ